MDQVDLSAVPGLRDAQGWLGMTFLPGKRFAGRAGNHWRDLETDALRLRGEYGLDTLVLLVRDDELVSALVHDIEAVLERHGIDVVRHPIRDRGIPQDRPTFRQVLDDVAERLRSGRRVAIACMGGLGRTGTAVACLLVDAGLDAESAIALTRRTRSGAIEVPEQEAFIRSWGSGGATRAAG